MSDFDQEQLLVRQSLDQVETWVECHNYRGYEPFDGLSSWFRPLTSGNLFAERLLLQLIRQCPINLRQVMGVKPKESTKGRGYMAGGYLARYRTTGDADYLHKAESCLAWLDRYKAPKFKHHSWSNHFDFASRGGSYTKEDPIIVWTALIGFAYLDAFEQTGNPRWLEIADSVCRWIMELPREKTSRGNCLSYLAHTQSSIHNSNMLGAAMLARTARHTGNQNCVQVAHSAMEYSCTRQLADGSWWYAEDPKYHWIDNFHTGYNLDSLRTYIESTGDDTWGPDLRKGLEFYKAHFFEENGCPKYYHDRRYPVDSQCAAQSIETLATFSAGDPDCLQLANHVAQWTIERMQSGDGHFYYRIYPWGKAKTPMLHWAQATMYKALALLLERLVEKRVAKDRSRTQDRGDMRSSSLQYALITPARNEDAFIELTIQSVVNQTIRPTRWVVVSDGSTDSTNEIVTRYARQHDWIELLEMPRRQGRDFGGKANSINAGYSSLVARQPSLSFDVIGSLDADITFEKDYFAFLLQKFADNSSLGLAGTPFSENGETYDYRFSSAEHVSGACQVFRRECFEAIGGYVPVKGGGIDVIAVLTARSKGWRTRTFTEKVSHHHRLMGSAQQRKKILADFALGQKDYRLGFHPVWEVFRSLYQMTRRPYVIGGSALFTGYFWAMLHRRQRSVGPELLKFQREDQIRRLRKFFGIRVPTPPTQDELMFNKIGKKCDSLE